MAAYVPNRGDIVHLLFDPATGQEMKGDHFGLIISQKVRQPDLYNRAILIDLK